MKIYKISSKSVVKINHNNGVFSTISYAKTISGDLVALRERDAEVRVIGYIRDLPQFTKEVQQGVSKMFRDLYWNIGNKVNII